jgi:hypothetical protein
LLLKKGEVVMAKVIGFTPIELHPGVNGEDFERFWSEEYAPFGAKIGWKGRIFKADRGERDGKYAVMWEMDSVEARDRYVPTRGVLTDEAKQALGPTFRPLSDKLGTSVMSWPFTDYVELDEP